MRNPRMTTKELMEDMRGRGLPMTLATISECLKSGIFPFGHVLNEGTSGRTTFLILRKDYERWAEEYLDAYTSGEEGSA